MAMSPWIRKVLFYGGIPVTTLGVLSFLHAMIAFTARLVKFDYFTRAEHTEGGQAVGSIILAMLGIFFTQIGSRKGTQK
jgi:hypothetical protein